MEREILTYPVTAEQMNNELSFMVEYFSNKGIKKCSVLFGFAWGNDYYPGNEWLDEEIELKNLIQKVKEVEASNIGAIGKDELSKTPTFRKKDLVRHPPLGKDPAEEVLHRADGRPG